MSRSRFGGTVADSTNTIANVEGHRVLEVAAATLTFWTAKTGGSQYTDLQLDDGTAVEEINVPSATGQIPVFYGPETPDTDPDITEVWADGGGGERTRMVAEGRSGPAGPPGAPGGSDAAFATFVTTPSGTQTALDGRFPRKAAPNLWADRNDFGALARRDGKVIDLTHASLFPGSRPRADIYSGNSHPIGTYFAGATSAARLAAAQVFYPTAVTEDDEADLLAMEAALLAGGSSIKNWGYLGFDWEQRGTALVQLPPDVEAVVNRTLTRPANSNRNVVLRSESPWGASIRYTGVDGGRILDLPADGVGTVLLVENLVLRGGGIRMKGPFRGLLRVGSGCHVFDSPHPAIQAEDTNPGVGVVGLTVEDFYTTNCAGSFWFLASTACITSLDGFRFLFNTDIPIKVSSIDTWINDGDLTGVQKTKAESGNYPYIQITANPSAPANITVTKTVRYGSEAVNAGSTHPTDFAPPMEYVIVGRTPAEVAAEAATPGSNPAQLFGNVKIGGQFRANAPTSVMARAAIKVEARVNSMYYDDGYYEGFKDCLVDEAYLSQGAPPSGAVRWLQNNMLASTVACPIFSAGGVAASRADRRPIHEDSADGVPFDPVNLLGTFQDLTSGSWTNTTTTAVQDVSGPGGIKAYTLTRTGATSRLLRSIAGGSVTGTPKVFGVIARAGTPSAGELLCTLDIRAQQGGVDQIPYQKGHRLSSEWCVYWLVAPKITAGTSINFSIYPNRGSALNTGSIQVCGVFAHDGLMPMPPRLNLNLFFRSQAPSPLVPGIYGADGVAWDPLARAAALPYVVFYNGSAYKAISAA